MNGDVLIEHGRKLPRIHSPQNLPLTLSRGRPIKVRLEWPGSIVVFDDDTTERYISVDTLHHSLTRLFAEKIASAGLVERIYMSFIDKEIDLWTIFKKDSKEERERLYKIELDIMKTFKEFSFDFHIYPLADINLSEFERDPGVFRVYPFPVE